MKNILPNHMKNTLYPYVTNYRIEGDKLIINCSNYPEPVEAPYSKEAEEEVLETMKKQAQQMFQFEEEYKRKISKNQLNAFFQGLLAASNGAFLAANTNNSVKAINILAVLICGTSTIISAAEADEAQEKLDEINKYKYFLAWEEEINEEIIDRYHQFYGKDAPIEEANIMTINDLDKYTLTEIKEIVEHISRSKDYILRLSRRK